MHIGEKKKALVKEAYVKTILGGVIQLRRMHILCNLIRMGQIFVVAM